ncbi:unnamed protein product [Echinostoma caproni]|uniref:Uncharacterized protein n=1 Tax=Echinostoma caproni TaxID=27848 RepID=A0A183B8G2_9TREM|nr:unnamed protein product [Echinostoma caproni]
MHELALTQHVTNPTRRQLGKSSSTLALVVTKSRSDIGNTAMGAPLGGSDHTSIRFQHGCALSPSQGKLRRRYGGMSTECPVSSLQAERARWLVALPVS